MVLGLISIIVGLVGFGWAGWKDLKTTEFPDWIPYSMIVFAVGARAVMYFLEGDLNLLYNSGVVGILFLGFGLFLYYTKQWGDGDAWLLGAMGFLFPEGLGFATTKLPFPVMILVTFFFIAFIYIIVYSVALGVKEKKINTFLKGFRKDLLRVILITIIFSVALVFVVWSIPTSPVWQLFYLFPPLLFLLLVFFHYGKFIEGKVFKRRISVKNLREGDVPVGKKWRVITKKEIAALKRKGGTIWIKEGVRFAPVFVMTLIALFLLGDITIFLVF